MGGSATTDLNEQGADRRTERALVAYVRQELSAPATAIMGYAEMLMDDAAQAGCLQFTDDLQRILDASRTLHRLILRCSIRRPSTWQMAVRTRRSDAGGSRPAERVALLGAAGVLSRRGNVETDLRLGHQD